VEVSPVGSGTVEIDGKSPATFPANITFDSGKSVPVIAVPASGYVFNGWSGDLTGAVNPTEISMTCTKNITANFSRVMHNLSININGGGSTDPPVGSHSYAEGEVITLVATPDRGWRFDSWTGDVANPASSTTQVNVNTSKSVSVNYVKAFPIWLLTIIIIVALALIGLAGYYVIRRHYRVIPKPLLTNTRSTRSSTRERRKNKRR
jgi:uncharacterized repeat protein (TIGR02543 family)